MFEQLSTVMVISACFWSMYLSILLRRQKEKGVAEDEMVR